MSYIPIHVRCRKKETDGVISMEQEVLKILSSGKSLDRYERVLHLLNSEDSGEYEEDQPQRKKRFLGWGCIGKNSSVLIIAQKEEIASVCRMRYRGVHI